MSTMARRNVAAPRLTRVRGILPKACALGYRDTAAPRLSYSPGYRLTTTWNRDQSTRATAGTAWLSERDTRSL